MSAAERVHWVGVVVWLAQVRMVEVANPPRHQAARPVPPQGVAFPPQVQQHLPSV